MKYSKKNYTKNEIFFRKKANWENIKSGYLSLWWRCGAPFPAQTPLCLCRSCISGILRTKWMITTDVGVMWILLTAWGQPAANCRRLFKRCRKMSPSVPAGIWWLWEVKMMSFFGCNCSCSCRCPLAAIVVSAILGVVTAFFKRSLCQSRGQAKRWNSRPVASAEGLLLRFLIYNLHKIMHKNLIYFLKGGGIFKRL